jgi:hypothetical protein
MVGNRSRPQVVSSFSIVLLNHVCHFERRARPGALLIVSYQAGNPGLGQGEIFAVPHVTAARFLPLVEMTEKAMKTGITREIVPFCLWRHGHRTLREFLPTSAQSCRSAVIVAGCFEQFPSEEE